LIGGEDLDVEREAYIPPGKSLGRWLGPAQKKNEFFI